MGGSGVTRLERVDCDPLSPAKAAAAVQQGLARSRWVQMIGPGQARDAPQETLLPEGAGVLLSGGGSSGERRLCLHPVSHLDRSAAATAAWLQAIDIQADRVLLLNPLPLHHVSGLMPWWRSRCWGTDHSWLAPAWMKDGAALMQHCSALPGWRERPVLLSLVPTQLARLLTDPVGVSWLQQMAVIWIGGAALSLDLADRARAAQLRLAPCYGATETAAMVAALPPQRFLAGETSCGEALEDVELLLSDDGAVLVRCRRLAVAAWAPRQPGHLRSLTDANGWWRSGDRADLRQGLNVLGRLDGALQSGGETVFPEQLEQRLMAAVRQADLPVEAVLLLGIEDAEWGHRLVAVVRCPDPSLLQTLETMTRTWPAAERPKRWLHCPELSPNAAGKWQRQKWRDWIRSV